MGRFSHECRVADLCRFKNLARNRAIRLANQERSASGFSGILNHTTNTDRTIEFGALFVGEVRILERLKDTFLLGNQDAGKDLFIAYRIFFQSVGHHVVNILDKDDVCVLLIEVLDECAVPSRPEEEFAILGTERRTVRISRQGIGTRHLLGESDVITHVIFILKLLEVIRYMLAEERQVIMGNGKMEIYGRFLSILSRRYTILRSFDEMFQRGRTRAITIFMEKE